MKQIDDIVKELAKLYPNIKTQVLEDIVRSQSKFTKNAIQSGEFPIIIWPYLGKFYPDKRKKEYWTNKLKDVKQDSGNSSGLVEQSA